MDILNVAYNMFSQGIDPELHIEDINEIIEVYERCCKMPIDARHPYAGKLVFTAFSGSHQDAINKGKQAMAERQSDVWAVPYLPIDPADIRITGPYLIFPLILRTSEEITTQMSSVSTVSPVRVV